MTSQQDAKSVPRHAQAAFGAALVLSLFPILFALVSANVDWFDRLALLAIWMVAAGYGLPRLFAGRSIPISATALYWAVAVNALDSVDKFEGYGTGEGWLLPWMLTRPVIAIYLLWLLVSRRRASLLIATVLLFVPLTNLPVDVVRNLVIHRDVAPFNRILITKASASDIYGLHTNSDTHVRWIRPSEHGLLVRDEETAGLGSGSMPPQLARSPGWYRALLERMLNVIRN